MRALLVLALLTAACLEENVPPPDAFFDPAGRARLPDGAVLDGSPDSASDATAD